MDFLLYHINFGFPLVDEHARIVAEGITGMEPRTEHAKGGLERAMTFQPPENDIEEECFYYSFDRDAVKISLENPSLGPDGMRARLCYNTKQLPEFTEWKMMRSREYVCGFAPGTNRLEGRANALQNEKVRWLQPLERADFDLEFQLETIA